MVGADALNAPGPLLLTRQVDPVFVAHQLTASVGDALNLQHSQRLKEGKQCGVPIRVISQVLTNFVAEVLFHVILH
jgi:hypothetical protein